MTMTTQPTDEGKPLEENLNAGNPDTAEFIEDTDPMIAEMRAAEAEIAGETGTQPPAEAGTKPAEAAAPKDKGPAPMIPKPRFDEVLSENALLRAQVGYLRGLADARKVPEATQQIGRASCRE